MTAILAWQRASFWPQDFAHRSFDSSSVESAAAFVERFLKLYEMAADPATVIDAVLDDIAGWSGCPPHAAIAVLEVGLARTLTPPPDWLRAMATFEATQNTALVPAALEGLAQIVPELPVSLAGPLFLDRAAVASDDRTRVLLDAVWPMLSARGAADVGPASSRDRLAAELDKLLPVVRQAGARNLLAHYVDGPALLDRRRTDRALEAIIRSAPPEPLTDLSLEDRAALWRQEIAGIGR